MTRKHFRLLADALRHNAPTFASSDAEVALWKRLQALRAEILGPPKKVEAIEVEAQPSGLLAPIETSAEPFKPAEPESPEELARREKKIEEQASWQQEQKPGLK